MGLWALLAVSVVGVSSGFCCRSQAITMVPAEDIAEMRMYADLMFDDIVSKQFGLSYSFSGALAQRHLKAFGTRSALLQHEWLRKALIACDVWCTALADKIACSCMEPGSFLVVPRLVVDGVMIFKEREFDVVQVAKRYDVLKSLHKIYQ